MSKSKAESIKSFVKHAQDFDSGIKKAVASTVMESIDACFTDVYRIFGDYEATEEEAFELASRIAPDTEATKKSKSKSNPRKTEWKDFVMAAQNCDLEGALGWVQEKHPGFINRQNMFRFAKKLWRESSVPAKAFKAAMPASGNGKAKTPVQKVGMGIGVIKNVKARKGTKIAEFQNEFEKLCNKYGFNY